ncbi:hypothetical protein ACMFMG_004020 [Clarireedia jacksonii]
MTPVLSTNSDERNVLLPSLTGLGAHSQPDRLFCAFLKSENVDGGLATVSYSDCANAINKCACWLQERLGKGDGLNMETIGYLGPPDLRHAIMALAVAKINHKTLVLSPRNSTAGMLKLPDCVFVTKEKPVLRSAKGERAAEGYGDDVS